MTHPVREAAKRAADWLEANPDKHIQRALATTGDPEHPVPPDAPDATCFCALGRFALELGVRDYAGIQDQLNELRSPRLTSEIWMRNDNNKSDGIAILREIARG